VHARARVREKVGIIHELEHGEKKHLCIKNSNYHPRVTEEKRANLICV
jgi:hypothetical protein